MKLKDVISTPCGLRYMADALDIQSGVARRMLTEQEMMTEPGIINAYYDTLQQYRAVVAEVGNMIGVKNLQFRLTGLKDLRTTLQNLEAGHTLDDIELFEVKHLAMLTAETGKQVAALQLPATLPDLEEVVRLLDPEGLRIATFYVYEAYSEKLRSLRSALDKNPTDEQIFNQVQEEELRIRQQLSRDLRPHAGMLRTAQQTIADIDIMLAKALQADRRSLCFPRTGTETALTEMWNPEVEEALRQRGKTYQRNSIHFGAEPTILTGSNMGGKTVVLKTVGLCQYLMQFGFGVPAKQAVMMPREEICCCMTDGQSVSEGLSSFAAEMRAIDKVIHAAREGRNILALIDEPARTTNPTEGTALVSALIEVLKPTGTSVLIVTHYTINAHACPCMRVKGMENGEMNYELTPAKEGEVPHEALRIAEQLGIDKEWIEKANKQI